MADGVIPINMQVQQVQGTTAVNYGMFAAIWFLLVLIVYLVLWIIALVGVLKAKNADSWKTNWILVLVLVPVIGLILWWALGMKERQ